MNNDYICWHLLKSNINGSKTIEENNNNIVIYQTDDGTTKIDVKLEDETVWLSQQQMADLYDTTKQNISLHIKNIFDEEELDINSTVKEFLTVQKEGISSINGSTLFALTKMMKWH